MGYNENVLKHKKLLDETVESCRNLIAKNLELLEADDGGKAVFIGRVTNVLWFYAHPSAVINTLSHFEYIPEKTQPIQGEE